MLKLRKAFHWIIFIVSLATLFMLMSDSKLNGLEMGGDFIQYWSAGRLNLLGENPYNNERQLELQIPHAPALKQPLITMLPIWMYVLIMPIAALPYSTARIVWFFGQLILIFTCTNMFWVQYMKGKRWLWLTWCITFLHWATLEVLRGGQISPFVLAGAIFFMIFAKKDEDWLAGVMLAFVLVKPHILYLFTLSVILWVIDQHRWRVLAGWGLALFIGAFIACLPNWNLLGQYIQYEIYNPPIQWITSTIGGQLRQIYAAEQFWLQFLPMLFGFAWFAWYWSRHHRHWNWSEQLPILSLVSLSTAAYGWRHDQIIVLLAILPAFTWLIISGKSIYYRVIFIGLYLSINVIALFNTQPQVYFWWVPLAILVWFYAVHKVYYNEVP